VLNPSKNPRASPPHRSHHYIFYFGCHTYNGEENMGEELKRKR